MTSPRLQILQRQMERKNPERIPAPPADGIGAAIEKLIADEVATRVGEELEERHSARVDRLFAKPKPTTSFDQIPAPPKAPIPPFTTRIYRDGAGLALWTETTNGVKTFFHLYIRDGAGRTTELREIDGPPHSLTPDKRGTLPHIKGD